MLAPIDSLTISHSLCCHYQLAYRHISADKTDAKLQLLVSVRPLCP